MVEECTEWTDAQMMTKKSGAARAIIKSLRNLQNLCNRKAKRLHTDGAKEEETKELRDYLDKNGITMEKTAPNTFQSNAFAERRFQQLMDSTRTAEAAESHLPKSLWWFATLDAAEESNYVSTSKRRQPQMSPNKNIETKCPGARFTNPSTFLPWRGTREGCRRKQIQKIESRATDAWYLRKRYNNLYQIWLQRQNK